MIVGIGTDILLVSRFAEAREKHGERLLSRVFTLAEADYCLSQAEPDLHFAARFAAKEAAMKALGTGWAEGIAWNEIEVTRQASGRPQLVLHGAAETKATSVGCNRIHLSLTHDQQYGAAFVVLESDAPRP